MGLDASGQVLWDPVGSCGSSYCWPLGLVGALRNVLDLFGLWSLNMGLIGP